MLKSIRKHRVRSAAFFFIFILIPVAQAWWQSFSNEPMFPALYSLTKKMPFSLYWITIPLALVGVVMLTIIVYDTLTRRASLQIKYDQMSPYISQRDQITTHWLGIYNNGPANAENVDVKIRSITPEPKQEAFRSIPPFWMNPRHARVQANQEELFQIARSWVVPGGYVDLDQLNPNARNPEWLRLDRDATIRLRVEVSAANAEARFADLALRHAGDRLVVRIVNSGPLQ